MVTTNFESEKIIKPVFFILFWLYRNVPILKTKFKRPTCKTGEYKYGWNKRIERRFLSMTCSVLGFDGFLQFQIASNCRRSNAEWFPAPIGDRLSGAGDRLHDEEASVWGDADKFPFAAESWN